MMRIQALLLVALLAGCAAQASGQNASVDVNALVRSHPLYSSLSEYDRQIAQLRGTLHVPEFARKTQAFENASRAVRTTLEQTASRTRQIAAMPSPDVSALKNGTNVNAPSESRVRSDMQQAYSNQAAQVRDTAQGDMSRYRAQLLAQQNRAFENYVRSVHARVQQAYTSREQQLYEKESTLALDLAKADANTILSIRTKLRTLALTGERRRRLMAQADAISAREDAAVAKQRKRDQAVLAAFLGPLQARADADIARMRAQLQARTAANLAARERVLAAQISQRTALDLGSSAQPAAAKTDMNAQLNSLLAAPAGNPQTFLSARDDLAQQFGRLRSADDDATRSTWAEIAALETQRAQLYSDIVSQIMSEARSIARERGLGAVYARNDAPPGSEDITPAVRSDFAALTR
jgi:hypothetical protein